MVDFRERYGPWGIVAGAGEGLGAAYARALAARGLHLLLIDQRADLLATLAPALERAHGITTHALVLDLAAPDLVEQVGAASTGTSVGLLVYNAAVSHIGPFTDPSADTHRRLLAVNCLAPALLAHQVGRDLRQRGRGGIILMSSLSGFQGHPFLAHYAASKAYNLVLAEGLWDELAPHGIDVLAVCPGATRTPGYLASRRGTPGRCTPPEAEPETVVAEALAALGRGPFVIPGRANRLAAFVMRRCLSRRRAVRTMGRVTRRLLAAAPPASR